MCLTVYISLSFQHQRSMQKRILFTMVICDKQKSGLHLP